MKEVSYSFCGGFEYLHCVGPGEYRSEDGLHKVFGLFAFGFFPQSDLCKMGKRCVFGTYLVGLLH